MLKSTIQMFMLFIGFVPCKLFRIFNAFVNDFFFILHNVASHNVNAFKIKRWRKQIFILYQFVDG